MKKKAKKESKERTHTIIGLVEPVTIKGKTTKEKHLARIDTGAAKSSIDSRLVYKLKLGPVLSVNKVSNAHGTTLRPVIEAEIKLKRRKIKSLFTVADRSNMKYAVLIGRNVLKQEFLIDPSKADPPYEKETKK